VVGDDEKVPPMYIHDRNNPQIEVGATFPNSKSFKVALRQLVIREDWAFITQHSDTKRFNGRCTDQDCPWKIHAYKIKNASTFMVCLRYFLHCFFVLSHCSLVYNNFSMLLQVSKLPFLHTCGSANCSKGMANRKWLADKGKAAIQHDSTVSANQLRENLQKMWTARPS
jgi:hypothetical protein